MKNLLKKFEKKEPEVVYEWNDTETEAKGWIVINSLRGGAAAGGTRMHPNVSKEEVLALAKTMEVKFTVSGPQIGGGKSGIKFDPKDKRKKEVLKRWFAAAKPLLKSYYGTGGDMNIDEVEEVIPLCKKENIKFPLEGVINGHYTKEHKKKDQIISQLTKGVPLIVDSKHLTPNNLKKYSVGDLITGYGVSESIIHYYNIYGGNHKNKRVIIQGWGNVASSTAYYLAQSGAKIVGIIDVNGGLINRNGYSLKEIKSFFENKSSNFLEDPNMISFEKINKKIWSVGAEIFVPAAASRLVSKEHLSLLIENGLEVISAGANVPFSDKEIFFGPVANYADKSISVIPDFIANCGMARAFSYFMENDIEISDQAVFKAVSDTIKQALTRTYNHNNKKTEISKTAFKIALKSLV